MYKARLVSMSLGITFLTACSHAPTSPKAPELSLETGRTIQMDQIASIQKRLQKLKQKVAQGPAEVKSGQVWYVHAPLVTVKSKPTLSSNLSGVLTQGTPVLGELTGQWIRMGEERYVHLSDVSRKAIPRPAGEGWISYTRPY